MEKAGDTVQEVVWAGERASSDDGLSKHALLWSDRPASAYHTLGPLHSCVILGTLWRWKQITTWKLHVLALTPLMKRVRDEKGTIKAR